MEIPKTPGTQPAMTYEQYKEIVKLKRLKEAHNKTYGQLAKELGLHPSTVTCAARRGVKRYDYAMWKEEQERS